MLKTAAYTDLIRPAILESLIAYAQTGRPTGGFLRAVLANDLMGATARADDRSRVELYDICTFVRMQLPGDCWGSPERVHGWIATRGMKGRETAHV